MINESKTIKNTNKTPTAKNMKKSIIISLLALIGIMPIFAEVNQMTTAQFKDRIYDYSSSAEWKFKGKKPVIIDFYTTWCGPCKRLAPIMEELSEKYKGRVVFYKVDIEKEPELAAKFQISSIPQVLYIPMKGKPQKLVGLYPKDQIEEIITQFLLPAAKKK